MNDAVETSDGGSSSNGAAEVSGQELVSSQSEAVALNTVAIIANEAAPESLLTADSESPNPDSTIPIVDSLTLALEAIERKKSAACIAVDGESHNDGIRSALPAPQAEVGKEDRPPVRRASSLKMVNRQHAVQSKKAVRFADAMGLDLALVRHVFDLESPPVIPPQAMQDLILPPDEEVGEEADTSAAANKENISAGNPSQLGQSQHQQLYLSPSFAQPGSAPNFKSRITSQKVVLEKANYHASTPDGLSGGKIRGLIRVANLGFEKHVKICCTVDSWRSSTEVVAEYQFDGCDNSNGSDQFAFSFSLPDGLTDSDRVSFCVAYSVNSQTYWDNNFGDNYSFHCVALDTDHRAVPEPNQTWSGYI